MTSRPCCQRICFIAALFFVALPAGAQESASSTDPVMGELAGRVRLFLESIAAGSAENAYRELLAGSLLARQNEAIKTLIAKTTDLTKYGRYRAIERINFRRVGNDVVLLKYLYKCEKLPVVWHFVFYRTPAGTGMSPEDDAWRTVSVRFDTELEALWY